MEMPTEHDILYTTSYGCAQYMYLLGDTFAFAVDIMIRGTCAKKRAQFIESFAGADVAELGLREDASIRLTEYHSS